MDSTGLLLGGVLSFQMGWSFLGLFFWSRLRGPKSDGLQVGELLQWACLVGEFSENQLQISDFSQI